MLKIQKWTKEKWPVQLLEIPQPPKELWILGDFPVVENLVYLCVVGSRNCTSYGREVCEKIIAGLQGYPVVIVSGFAMGIDTIAHKTAIKAGLKTVVFPGSGLSEQVMYPKINIQMIREVVDAGGCMLSEFPPDFKSERWAFPMRNRLMAGISKAVLIIEAEEKSGTLITARLAVEYNKDVLAVPGSIYSTNSKGTNRLLRQGATPITCTEDVLEALGFEKPNTEEKQKKLFEDLSIEEKKVVDLLREPISRDELLQALKMPIQKANTLLSAMEIRGIIKEEYGEIRLY